MMLNDSPYSVEFFDLQLKFAARVAELSGLSFAETVGSHTNIYVRLGMGQQLDVANPAWLEYVAALVMAPDPADWTHAVHCRRAHLPAGPSSEASVGCFSYALVAQDRARPPTNDATTGGLPAIRRSPDA
jgi:hypothetical protein